MNLLSCAYRHSTEQNVPRFRCDHPRIAAPGGLVTAEVCASCALRKATSSAEQSARTTTGIYELASGRRTGRSWRVEIKPGPRPIHQCDVVIPYHSNLQWVPQAIDSILWQRYVHSRIHLINDASPEEDLWLRRLYARQENICWYRNRRNLGPYRSIHQVWRYMTTDYLVIQDSDDLSLPNRLWLAVESLRQSSAEIFAGAAEQFLDPSVTSSNHLDREHVDRWPVFYSDERWNTCPTGYLMNPTVVMRRSLFKRMNGYHDLTSGGDLEFCARIGYCGVRIAMTDSRVVLRRVHSRSLSRSGKYQKGGAAQKEFTARLIRQYADYDRPNFNPAHYGCLDRVNPDYTERIERVVPEY